MDASVYIHPTAVVDDGAEVGAGSKVWHYSHIMGTARIGAGCTLGQNVFVGAGVVVGAGCKVQNNVSLYTGVVLADAVFVGPSVVFTNVKYPRAFIERKAEFMLTHIGRGASIGANATIVCGVRVGEYALVGAGAVVTHDVAAYALVVGGPARQVGWVSRTGRPLTFDAQQRAICPETHERYVLVGGVLVPD